MIIPLGSASCRVLLCANSSKELTTVSNLGTVKNETNFPLYTLTNTTAARHHPTATIRTTFWVGMKFSPSFKKKICGALNWWKRVWEESENLPCPVNREKASIKFLPIFSKNRPLTLSVLRNWYKVNMEPTAIQLMQIQSQALKIQQSPTNLILKNLGIKVTDTNSIWWMYSYDIHEFCMSSVYLSLKGLHRSKEATLKAGHRLHQSVFAEDQWIDEIHELVPLRSGDQERWYQVHFLEICKFTQVTKLKFIEFIEFCHLSIELLSYPSLQLPSCFDIRSAHMPCCLSHPSSNTCQTGKARSWALPVLKKS